MEFRKSNITKEPAQASKNNTNNVFHRLKNLNKNNLVVSLYGIVFALLIFSVIAQLTPKKNRFLSPIDKGFSVISKETSPYLSQNHVIFGFLPYWGLESLQYLQLDKLTDISFFALRINSDGSLRKIQSDGIIEPGYNVWSNSEELEEFFDIAREQNVRLSIAIISHEDDVSTDFLNCKTCWNTFISELILEMRQKEISNVNFDFEFVELVEDESLQNKYTEFIQFSHAKLEAEFGDSFVTVSAFADSFIKPRITQPDDLSKVTDAIFIMAYDFHYPGSESAGPVAPINKGTFSSYDLTTMLDDYKKNIPPSKIIMGVPYYGYNWIVDSLEPYATRIPGDDDIGYSVSQTYGNVMDTILEVNPQIQWDAEAKSPFFWYVSPNSGANKLVYYEDVYSLEIKYNLIKQENLLGVGIWALGYDGGYQELWDLLNKKFIIGNGEPETQGASTVVRPNAIIDIPVVENYPTPNEPLLKVKP